MISTRIVTVTPNPAIDVTYRVPGAQLDAVNRVTNITRRAGGKGLNVSTVLAQLGQPSHATGFLGGRNGELFRELLEDLGAEPTWIATDEETRTTTAVVSETTTTMFNEPGAPVSDSAWRQLQQHIVASIVPGQVVVISGSFPPGTGSQRVTRLLSEIRDAGGSVLLDTSGPLLLAGVDSGVSLVKPNHLELAEATGTKSVDEGARALLERGASTVAVSRGEEGLVLYHRDAHGTQIWSAAPVEVVHGNPTGAGDSTVAALSIGLAQLESGGDPQEVWPDALRRAVALSAAAVLSPIAGRVDLEAYERFLPNVIVKEQDSDVTR